MSLNRLSVLMFVLLFTDALLGADAGVRIGPPGAHITALARHATNADIRYAGTAGGGVFKSTDAGTTWTPINNGLFELSIGALAVPTVASDILYAGTAYDLYKTLDGGATWSRLGYCGTPSCGGVASIALVPGSTDTIFFARAPLLYKSTDGGLTAQSVCSTNGRAVVIDPSVPSTMYTTATSILKSTDAGETWAPLTTPNQGCLTSLIVDPLDSTLYAGSGCGSRTVQRSMDGGLTWEWSHFPVCEIDGPCTTVTFDHDAVSMAIDMTAAGDRRILVGTDGHGVFRPFAVTASPTFESVNSPLVVHVTAMLCDSTGVWFGGSKSNDDRGTGALFHTTFSDNSIVEVHEGLYSVSVAAVRLHESSGRLWAGAGAGSGYSDVGVWLGSEATSNVWMDVSPFVDPVGGLRASITDLALAASDPEVTVATDTWNVYRTTNGGSDWVRLPVNINGESGAGAFTSGGEVVIDPFDPLKIMVGYGGLHRSVDGGANWTFEDKGDVEVLSSDGTVIRAVAAGTLYESADFGGTWATLTTMPLSVTRAFLRSGTSLYAGGYAGGISAGGVARSDDQGITWIAAASGLPPEGVTSLAGDRHSTDTLYATVHGSLYKLYRTSDRGSTWQQIASFVSPIRSIAVGTALPTRLFLGSMGEGVISLDVTPGVAAANAETVETDTGAAEIVFPVRLSSKNDVPVTVHYRTIAGSATPGADYTAINDGIVTFNVGGTTGTVHVDVLADLDAEGPETFTLEFFDATGAVIDVSTVVGTILDDESFTTTTIDSSSNPSIEREPLTLSAAVSSEIAGPITGTVTFRDGASSLATVSLITGTASFTTTALLAGTHVITATYNGNNDYGSSESNAFSQYVQLPPFVRAADSGVRIGPPGAAISALAQSPTNASVRYAGTLGGGVYRSTDGGTSWTPINDGLLDLSILSLAVPTTASDVIYAGTYYNAYKSTDGGAHWQQVPLCAETYCNTVYEVAIAPGSVNTVFFGTNVGYYKSTDGGQTVHSTLDAPGCGTAHFAIDPSTPSTMYVNARGSVSYPGFDLIYKSVDGGETWSPLPSSDLRLCIMDLLIDPADSAIYFGNESDTSLGPGPDVRRSLDGGETWDYSSFAVCDPTCSTRTFDHNTRSLAIDTSATGDRRLLAGTAGSGVMRPFSISSGPGFESVASPLHVFIDAMLFDGTDLWFGGTKDREVSGRGALFRTKMSDQTRTEVHDGLYNANVSTVLYDGANERIWAGTMDNSGTLDAGLWTTPEATMLWSDIAPRYTTSYGTFAEETRTITIAPSDPAIAVIGAASGAIYRTTNTGASWAEILTGVFPDVSVAIDPNDTQKIVVGDFNGFRFTSDAGLHWTSDGTKGPVHSLAVDGALLRAIANATSYSSTDGGASWTEEGTVPLSQAKTLFRSGASLYASGAGVARSDNDGGTWISVGVGISIPNGQPVAMAPDPHTPDTLYATTVVFSQLSILYRSSDRGATWHPIASFPSAITSIAPGKTLPTRLYLGSNAEGVIRLAVTPGLVVEDAQVTETDAGSVDMVFPVRLSSRRDQSVTVHYRTIAGTATAGSDFTNVTDATIVFPAGNTAAQILVTTFPDSDAASETFTVELFNPTGAVIDVSTVVGTILDDELLQTGRDAMLTSEAPASALVGSTVRYKLTATNVGTVDLSDVTVQDDLPSGVTFTSASVSPAGSCSQTSGVVTCTISSLTSGASSVIDIDIGAPQTTGIIQNNARVTVESDENPGNDTDQKETVVRFPAPAITQVSPNFGPAAGGTRVVIDGVAFQIGARVFFGSGEATAVVVQSSSRIQATSPLYGNELPVDVFIRNPDAQETVLGRGFQYLSPIQLYTIAPFSGSKHGGTKVTLVGSGFAPGATILFGSAAGTNVVWESSTQLTVLTPPHAAGTFSVRVRNPDGSTSSSLSFTFPDEAALTVTAVSPGSGPASGGNDILVSGTGFSERTRVTFGAVGAGALALVDSTRLMARVPAQTGGVVVNVSVSDELTTATLQNAYTYVPSPSVSSFTPTSGTVGSSVTITGTNLTGATAVRFNGVAAASFTVNSATQITTIVPSGAASGPVSVTTPGGTATSTSSFTVIAAPTIASFTPTSGAVATSVTITGTNLSGATVVQFNGVAAASFTVNGATQITTAVPSDATSGVISVTTPDGTATSASSFTYLPRGDTNGDGAVAVGDIFYLINNLFAGGPAPVGPGDANGDGRVSVADIFYLINFLFAGGPVPV